LAKNKKAPEPDVEAEAAPPAEEQRVGTPDVIRLFGGGQIAVDDERFLGVNIPAGSVYFSEAVILALQDELAKSQELVATLRQAAELPPAAAPDDHAPGGVNMKGFLMGLPVGTLLDLAQNALNHLTMRQLSNACYDAGITPSFHLVDSHG
jgi:hypothetical protein